VRAPQHRPAPRCTRIRAPTVATLTCAGRPAALPPALAAKEFALKRMLINALDPEESRIAVVEDGVLQELHVELASREAYLGNIYKGKVVNIEPSIGAAFVSFPLDHCYLSSNSHVSTPPPGSNVC